MNTLLHNLLTTHSVTGCEDAARKIIGDYAKNWASHISSDNVGNLIVRENPAEGGILLAAHMDEIGLMVNYISDDGMLHVCKVGGIYIPMYFGHMVRIFTKNGPIYGSVSVKRSLYTQDAKVSDILIDIGARSKEDAGKYVEVGDVITFDSDYHELLNGRICGRNLDDKTGVYVIMEALRRAKEMGLKGSVSAVATVGEETSQNGACWAASRLKPRLAIVVDVTYTSDTPHGSKPEDYGEIALGKGPAICINPIINRVHIEELRTVAKNLNINLQYEASSCATCTDADRIHYAADGVEVLLVSIPLRYMHSACETGALQDMEDCINLISNYLLYLDENA